MYPGNTSKQRSNTLSKGSVDTSVYETYTLENLVGIITWEN